MKKFRGVVLPKKSLDKTKFSVLRNMHCDMACLWVFAQCVKHPLNLRQLNEKHSNLFNLLVRFDDCLRISFIEFLLSSQGSNRSNIFYGFYSHLMERDGFLENFAVSNR